MQDARRVWYAGIGLQACESLANLAKEVAACRRLKIGEVPLDPHPPCHVPFERIEVRLNQLPHLDVMSG